MNEAEYAKVKAVRSSHLKLLARSPAHYVHAVHEEIKRATDGDDDASDALKLGTVTHCLCLEQSEFDSRFMVYDADKRPSPTQTFGLLLNKQWRENIERQAKESGRELITVKMYEKALAMKKAIKSTMLADEVLNSVGIHEQLHVWTDKYTGIECKARTDKERSRKRGVDLKTTRDARPSAFIRDVFNLGYHVSAGFHMRGANLKEFAFVAVENTAPHGVLLYPLSQDAIDTADFEINVALRVIKQCRAEYGSEFDLNTVWPSYHYDHVDGYQISVPTWYKNQVGTNTEYQP